MRFIDKKGKLFGLINIFDLMVLMILGLLIIGGIIRVRSRPIVAKETSKAHIIYETLDVRMNIIENVEIGDPIYNFDQDGLVGTIAEKTHEPFTEILEKDGQWINAEVPDKYRLTFKVEADVKNNPDVVLAGGEEIRVGIQYRLKNKKLSFFATILEIELLD